MKEIIKIINKIVRKESQNEAIQILYLSSNDDRYKFLEYSKKHEGVGCFILLDKLKDDLVKQNLMKDDGDFGHWDSF